MTEAELKAYNKGIADAADAVLRLTVHIEGRRIALYGVRQVILSLKKDLPNGKTQA